MTNSFFQTVALVSRPGLQAESRYFRGMVKFLRAQRKTVLLDTTIAQILKSSASTSAQIKKNADLVLVFGGDGALLGAVRRLFGTHAAFAGVRLNGTLGFLTEYAPSNLIRRLGELFRGKFKLDERILLTVEVVRNKKVVKKMSALNEAVLSQSRLARLIKLDFAKDGYHIATFHADGAIVATPTGSTAYSLSAGGPIVHPSLHSFILTPINPHLLANRPLVLPDSGVITATVHDQNVTLTADGQTSFALQPNDKITLRKAEWRLQLAHPWRRNHFAVLRQKLNWTERD